MRSKWFVLLVAALAAGSLWGCGSNGGSGGDSTTGGQNPVDPDTGISYALTSECISCHKDFSWSANLVAAYLESTHVVHSDHITAASEAECLECHDPIGDGAGIEQYIDPANVPAEGLAAVGCENCHGPGGEHFGVGPIPDPTPDYTACGKCHDAFTVESHATYHPEGNNILSDYVNGGHFANEDSHNSRICSKCHTDEGAKLYKDIDTIAGLETVVLAVPSPSHPVQCRTCHDPHNPGELLESEVTSRSAGLVESAEYATCTNCHQDNDADVGTAVQQLAGSTSSDGGSEDGDLIYHASRYNRIITDTHYDNPETVGQLEGYAMAKTNERVCRDCHNVHAADITINEQWAESGHGGDILTIKNAAADAADADTIDQVIAVKTAFTTASWAGHGWPNDGEAECQRCHTATGGMNFLNAPVTYYDAMDAFVADQALAEPTGVANPNDFSYLATDPGTGEYTQQELLFCWACHTNSAGGMRDPGSVTLQDRNGDFFGPVPDVGKSNVCIGCHGGRANGEYIRNTAAADRTTSGRVHHLPAAGSLFSEATHTAYEFDLDGDSDEAEHYVNASLLHDTIDTTGDAMGGPCASCHMPGADHHFSVVEEDEDTGEITAITSQALCNTCHDGTSALVMNATVLQGLRDQYADVLQYFADVAYAANGQTNYAGVTFSNNAFLQSRGDDVAGQNDYGALQNVKNMTSDGGIWGYAHNSIYAKRIIFDSLDWLDNADLDGSITIPVGYAAARLWFAADADGVVTRP